MAVAVSGNILYTAPSPEAYLDVEAANRPLAIAAFDVLQSRGQAEAARQRLLEVLAEHNDDPHAFGSTSRYVVVSARRS